MILFGCGGSSGGGGGGGGLKGISPRASKCLETALRGQLNHEGLKTVHALYESHLRIHLDLI